MLKYSKITVWKCCHQKWQTNFGLNSKYPLKIDKLITSITLDGKHERIVGNNQDIFVSSKMDVTKWGNRWEIYVARWSSRSDENFPISGVENISLFQMNIFLQFHFCHNRRNYNLTNSRLVACLLVCCTSFLQEHKGSL